ncbi:DUF4378 domain-containing protein/VARLMGL domain-containing protein [Cephalotus follicularis]|uniref:DUF4378 domain-containing protein/VARLMGL domain-containing protein n=1 Tax=Cephalotus follicularis TaxID=3775 RepID=A0A1Q3B1J8_CEPFO|nr:DUF4378 domain-containing protein/VARLMGL domain-containing protein [Cephalotus follicularis]
MGREWYWVGSRSSKRGENGGERDGITTTTSNSSSSTPGCISAVFHFFDFQLPLHHRQPSSNPNSSLLVEPAIREDAPRHNLELEESPLPSITKEDEKLDIQMGIQIKTSGDIRSKVGFPNNDSSSEISSSPGIKTPTLVARLMGLDLLPEIYSPSCSSTLVTPRNLHTKSHLHHHITPRRPLQSKPINHKYCIESEITGTRSLPETPRISSARRSDVDHRLSLQISKENMFLSEELDFSRFSSVRRKEKRDEDENKNPSHHARQIVKQVKENVGRKVGLDITNTIRSRERNELVSQFKSKKSVKVLTKVVDEYSSPGKPSTPSCSPRLKFSGTNNKTNTPTSDTKGHTFQPPKPSQLPIQPQPIKVSQKPKLQPVPTVPEQQHGHQQIHIKKCKKAATDRFGPAKLKKPPQTSDIIRNKQEEPFVRAPTACRASIPDKKCMKTPLSCGLLNITAPTLIPVKKDPSPPATKVPPKLVTDAQESKPSSQLSSYQSQLYEQETTHKPTARGNNNDNNKCSSATPITVDGAEYEYVTRILRRIGIGKDTPVSCAWWFSPSHPLDPSSFYYLEHFTTKTNALYGQLGLRCNRKLLFHLVDEILVGILKPYINFKPWVSISSIVCDRSDGMQGSELIETLCMKVKSFPCADCRELEDIDAIVSKDLTQLKLRQQCAMAFEEEGEGIVTEIERYAFETLIHETAVLILETDVGFGL